MPKTLLTLLCLLFLLPILTHAQDATATPPQMNCPQATSERSLVSGLFISESIAPAEVHAYYFHVTRSEFWRFDLSSMQSLSFELYHRNYSGDIVTLTNNAGSPYSTIFSSHENGMHCFYTRNQTDSPISYSLRLTILRANAEAFEGAEGLTSSEAYRRLGDYFYFQPNYESALYYYELATAVDGNDALAWSKRCSALYQLGRYNEALESCESAVSLDPELNNGLFNRARVYESLGWYSSALSDYQTLEDRISYDESLTFNVAINFIFLGDATSAFSSMDYYYTRSDDWFRGYWRGIARLYAGDYQGAITDFENTIAIAEESPYHEYFMLGLAHQLAGNQAESEAAFLNAGELIQLERDPYTEHRFSALALLMAGDEAAARNHYRQMLQIETRAHLWRYDLLYLAILSRLFPNERIYYNNLIWLKSELGIN